MGTEGLKGQAGEGSVSGQPEKSLVRTSEELVGGASSRGVRLVPLEPATLARELSVTSYMHWIYFYL